MTIATYPPVNGTSPSAQLGYVEMTADVTGVTTGVGVIGTVSVYVAPGQRIRVRAEAGLQSTAVDDQILLNLRMDDTRIRYREYRPRLASVAEAGVIEAVLSPTAGMHTFTADFSRGFNATGTLSSPGTGSRQGHIVVEDVSGGTGGPGPLHLGTGVATAAVGGITGTVVDIPGASVTVYVPAGRTLRITAGVQMRSTVDGDVPQAFIREGAANLQVLQIIMKGTTYNQSSERSVIVNPTEGVHTYHLAAVRGAGTGTVTVDTAAGNPTYISVEDITGTPSPAGILPTSQTLAYSEATTSQANVAVGTSADVVGLSATFTVPAGRRIRVTARVTCFASLDNEWRVDLKEGNTRLTLTDIRAKTVTGVGETAWASVVLTPSAGTHTYKAVVARLSGTGDLWPNAGSTYVNWILVEDITGGAPAVPPANVPVGVLARAEYVEAAPVALPAGAYDIPNLSVNVVVPEGRTLKISHFSCSHAGTSAYNETRILRNGVQLNRSHFNSLLTNQIVTHDWSVFDSPPAGQHTYKVTSNNAGGGGTLYADGTNECYIVVEDVTATPAPASTAPSSTLAYVESTTAQGSITTTATLLTGYTATVTVPAGRRLRVTVAASLYSTVAGDAFAMAVLQDGVSVFKHEDVFHAASTQQTMIAEAVVSPSAGAHTYTVNLVRQAGTGTLNTFNASTRPGYILIEDITGVSVDVHDHNSAPTSTLGYAERVSNQLNITTETDLTGLSTTVTVPAGRRLKVTGFVPFITRTAGTATHTDLIIYEDGVFKQRARAQMANNYGEAIVQWITTPAAGSHTYKLRAASDGTVAVDIGNSVGPAYILVEDISGHGIPGHTHPEFAESAHTHSQLADSGWITLPLINGWVSYDNNYGPPRYRKLNGIVYVQGLIKNGTLGVSCAQLPVGYRPSLPKLLFGTMRNANVEARIDVQSDGHIIMALAEIGWTTLSGVTFPADQ